MTTASQPTGESPALRRWQSITIALMCIGYAGYYLCRSDLSVATPLIIKEFKSQGLDKTALGGIVSLATLFYAFGKFVSGSLADYWGGRRLFLLGMGGSILCTLVFGFGGLPLFTLAWTLNRAVQSMGWVGMVKITSKWFSYSTYGAAMGVISLSYLFGDFLSRQFLGQLIEWNFGWRQVFAISAGVLGVLFVLNLILLKDSPRGIGEPEPEANPENLFGEQGHEDKQTSLGELLAPLMRSGLFWVVCILSFGFTIVRETFGTWTPEYLTEVAKMSEGAAGKASSYFPLFGGISVLLCGYLSDRLGRGGRAILILVGLILAVPALLILGYANLGASPTLAVLALGAVAFLMIGPYSFLAGAISLDFGGKRGSATVCGWIDGIGYFGGILSGKGVGYIAQTYGWSSAFAMLAGVTAVSGVAAIIYWRLQTASRPVALETT